MVDFYLDTSALLKRYKTEEGSEVVDELFPGQQGEALITSLLTILEASAVAERMLKGRLLTQRAYDTLTVRFHADIRAYLTITHLDDYVMTEALDLIRAFALNAPDAIHLASALLAASNRSENQQLVFVSSDKELVAAAGLAGLRTIDPEAASAASDLRAVRG